MYNSVVFHAHSLVVWFPLLGTILNFWSGMSQAAMRHVFPNMPCAIVRLTMTLPAYLLHQGGHMGTFRPRHFALNKKAPGVRDHLDTVDIFVFKSNHFLFTLWQISNSCCVYIHYCLVLLLSFVFFLRYNAHKYAWWYFLVILFKPQRSQIIFFC